MKITFPCALFLIFMTLKLCNIVDWSWIWVTAPLWIAPAFVLAFTAMAFALAIVVAIFGDKK